MEIIVAVCLGSIMISLGIIASRLYDIARAMEKFAEYHTREYKVR